MDSTATLSNDSPANAPLAPIAVRVAGAWLFAGAFFKLFFGTPNLIPPLVRDYTPFSLILTYHVAIAVELAIVVLAMLKPRVGWIAITPLFAFFLVLLGDMLLKGQTNCGCFGKAFELHPGVMMLVDAACLILVLASRPWSASFRRGAPWAATAGAMAVGIALPWIIIGDKSHVSSDLVPVVVPSDGTTSTTPAPAPVDHSDVWIPMSPENWVGKSIYDVAEFTQWVPTDKIPTDGKIILWRQGCTHCAQHLREMAAKPDGATPILLVQVMDDLKDSPSVDAKPSGPNVTEFALPRGAVGLFETPAEIRLEGGNVTAVLHEKEFEAERGK
jgi:hypothetical protein